MFGKNALLKQDLGDGQSLYIKEIFPTIQGEGPLAGKRAIFVRVGGCNLRCFACDTDFDIKAEDAPMKLQDVISGIEKLAIDLPRYSQLVVITGGEPFRQNILPLITALREYNYNVQIETAGTLWLPGLERFGREMLAAVPRLMIICSPKTGKINSQLEEYVYAYKYVIRADETDATDGLPIMSTQERDTSNRIARPPKTCPTGRIYVQPWDDKDDEANAKNTAECIHLCLVYGYRLSLQLHKYLGLP